MNFITLSSFNFLGLFLLIFLLNVELDHVDSLCFPTALYLSVC